VKRTLMLLAVALLAMSFTVSPITAQMPNCPPTGCHTQ